MAFLVAFSKSLKQSIVKKIFTLLNDSFLKMLEENNDIRDFDQYTMYLRKMQ